VSKFVPIPNFDSLSPQTTKGDLIGRTTTGATRVPVGSDNTFLKADSSNALGVSWASPSVGALTVNTLTGATTLPATSQVILASSTTFAITLPSPSSNSGLNYRIVKTDDTSTPISVTGSGFIGVTLCTSLEEYFIICDGSTYWPSHVVATTGVTSITGISITATTSNPVKGNSISIDAVYWSRQGSYAHLRYEFAQGNTTGASIGSGDYLFNLPGGLSIDTTKVTGYSAVIGLSVQVAAKNMAGSGMASINIAGVNTLVGGAIVYDATRVRLAGSWSPASANTSGVGCVGMSLFPLVGASLTYAMSFDVPIAGWGG